MNAVGIQLLDGLGNYSAHTPKGHLHIFDAGKYLERAGSALGFDVVDEYKVPSRPGRRGGWVDYVWLRREGKREIIAAFEIEGRDVHIQSIRNDFDKLTHPLFDNATCWMLLFQVDRDFTPKRTIKDQNYSQRVKRELAALGNHHIQVVMDVELMNPAYPSRFIRSELAGRQSP